MAKKESEKDKEAVTYLGQDIDPDLQKKVEEYMEVEEKPQAQIEKPSSQDVAAAPLLPTDKLPQSIIEESPKTSKIEVVEHADVAPSAPEVPSTEEAQSSTDKDDKEPIAPVSEPQVSSDETSEEPAEIASDPAEEVLDEAETKEKPLSNMAPLPIPLSQQDQTDELGLESSQTSKAVEDIISTEADELLAAQDAKRGVVSAENAPKKPAKVNIFALLFKNPKTRKVAMAAVGLACFALLAMPVTRYFLLNTAGVRVSTSMKILDAKTAQPLKNVELTMSGRSAKSDAEGLVKLDGIKLGSQTMVIKKPAFAEISRQVTIGLGSNPQGEVKLAPIGTQYSFILTDFLSGKPIVKAEVAEGEASARSNEKGEAILTVPTTEKETLEVQITADMYRTEKVAVSTTKKEQQKIAMSPSRKAVFVSKRSGKFDLYKVDVDGKNEQLVMAGTGIEREDSLAVVAHPKKEIIAYLSTRENVRNRDGFLLSTLNIINLSDNSVTKVAQSERIQIVDWIGDRLVYVAITQGASEANVNRHKLMSYDVSDNTPKELASTNYFNDVISANGSIYYSPAQYKVNGAVGLYKINADGSNKKTVYQKEAWNLFRTSYEKVSISIGQDWYDLNLNTDMLTKAGGAPSVLKSRVYVASPENKRSIWVDERDGKGVLLAYDNETKQDKVLHTQSGIKSPIRWLDEDHVVYRVADGRETADYVMSLSGGEPKKIKDVTNTAGIDRWYYY